VHGHQPYEPDGSAKVGRLVKTIDQRSHRGADEDTVFHSGLAELVGVVN
jgi:hypothetical protein